MPWNKDGTRKKSVLYKKQKFGEAVSPFMMKYSSSAFPFKSPLKQAGMEFESTGDETGTGTVHVGPFGSELKIEQEQRRKYGTKFTEYPGKKTGWKAFVEDVKSTIPKK